MKAMCDSEDCLRAASEVTDTNKTDSENGIRAASEITDTNRPGSEDLSVSSSYVQSLCMLSSCVFQESFCELYCCANVFV